MHALANATESGTKRTAAVALRHDASSMAFWSDAVLYALQLDDLFQVRNISKAGAKWVGSTPSQLLGCELASILRPDIADERLKHCREVLNSRQSVTIDGVIRGEGLRSSIRCVGGTKSAGSILMSFWPIAWVNHQESETAENGKIRIAAAHDLGPLGALTAREMDVLVLVAVGKSTSEIAFTLNRSRRTIDCHRATISKKLAIPSIAELSLITYRAGLIRVSQDSGQRQSTHPLVLGPNTQLLEQIIRSRSVGSRSCRKRFTSR